MLAGWNAILKKQALTPPARGELEETWASRFHRDTVHLRVYEQHAVGSSHDTLDFVQYGAPNEVVSVSAIPDFPVTLAQDATGPVAQFLMQRPPVECLNSKQETQVAAMLRFLYLVETRIIHGTSALAREVQRKLGAGALQETDTQAATYVTGASALKPIGQRSRP